MMRTFIFACLLLAPLAAAGQDMHCKHAQPRELQLDLVGIETIVFEVGPHRLDLQGAAGAAANLQGRACASQPNYLQQLTLTQRKSGDRLLVRLHREGLSNGSINSLGELRDFVFGSNHAHLELTGNIPDHVRVELDVGSGDASVRGVAAAALDVGSGDVAARDIEGLVTVAVGSGDVDIHDVGSLRVSSLGSGDLLARRVNGDAAIGSIGSGDAELREVSGKVEIGSIGSGDATLADVTGDVALDSIGSGDLQVRNARGALRVRSIGSGDVDHSGVDGTVSLPRRH